MGRHPLIPKQLTKGPFSLAEARRAGLTRWHLYSPAWRRVAPGIYAWAGLPDEPMLRIAAAAARLPESGAFAGLTAAWLHGLDARPAAPIEVIVPAPSGVSARDLWVTRARLEPREVVERWGVPATSILRTLSDLGRRLPLVEAVVLADQALYRGLVELEELDRRLSRHAEPKAESPMETRLRMLLVQGGLPRPQAQVDLRDEGGRLLGRADLYYPGHCLVLEYDGGTHRDRMVDDNRRQNALLGAGYNVLRFTAPDVLGEPDTVVAQVRAALGRPKPTFS